MELLVIFLNWMNFVCDVPVGILFMKADDESDDQSGYAGNHNHRNQTDAPPSTS